MKHHLALAGLVATLACGGDGAAAPGSGETAIYLADAPFPFDQVSRVDVHVVRVELTRGDTADVGSVWLTVAQPDRAFNLLELQGGTTTLLGSAEVPPGHYGAVRIELDTDRSSMTMANGTVLRGVVGDQEGILWQSSAGRPVIQALVFEPMAVAENGADIVIDFDAGRSFISLGTNQFVFSPYIRAVNRHATGMVTGTVVAPAESGGPLPVGRATVEVYRQAGNPGSLAATAMTDAAGAFRVAFLAPGTYWVRAFGTLAVGLRYGDVDAVAVSAGGSVPIGSVLLDREPAYPADPPVDSTGSQPPPPPPPPGGDTLTVLGR